MSTTDSIVYDGVEYSYNTFTAAQISDYKGLRDMYYGAGGFKDGTYLEPFPRESQGGKDENNNDLPNFFALRKKLAHYENIFAPELDAKIDPIFGKDQIRTLTGQAIQAVQSFIDQPTKKHSESMSEYQRRKAVDAELYGAIFEILDGPNKIPENGGSDTNIDVMEYSYFITPLNTYAYGLDNDGTLNLLIYYEDIDSRNTDQTGTTTSTDKDSYIYRVWIKKPNGEGVTFKWYQEEIQIDSIHEFESFPVDLVESNKRYKSNEIAQSSYLSELSICKKIYNLTSWYNDSFFKNCFAILVYNGKLPDNIDLGASSLLQYHEIGSNAPQYIAPPTEHLQIQIQEVERLVQQLQSNMTSTVAISAMASGDSRKEADKRRIEKLKQLAQNIQDQEIWLVNDALKNYINTTYEYKVLYIKDFESLTKADEIEPIQGLIDSGAMTPQVINELGADMIKIVYSNDEIRAKKLMDLQKSTFQDNETNNDTFDDPPEING